MAVKGKVDGGVSEEELLKLVDRTWNKEATEMYKLEFDSEQHRAQYLRQSKLSRNTVHCDLKNLLELANSSKDVHLYRTICKIYDYSLFAYDFAYQYVAEPILRAEYIGRISLHSKQMEQEAVAASDDKKRLGQIADDAAWYRNTMMHYIDTEQEPQEKSFVSWMLQCKLKVEDIVKRFTGKLKFKWPFNKLTTVQKLQVWNEIIKESGKSRFEITRDLNSLSELGVMVLLITASIIVFRIFIADHKPARILKNGTTLKSSRVHGVDGFAVDAMNTVCWWGKLPDKYKPLPAEVIYGEKVAKGITAEKALIYSLRVTFLASGVVWGVKYVGQIIRSGEITVTGVEEDTDILLQDLSEIGAEAGAGAAEAETSFIEGTGLLEGELAGELLAEEALAELAAVAVEAAPVVAAVAVVVLVGFILFKLWKH